MKLGIDFFTWASIIAGGLITTIGFLLWSNDMDGGVICIAIGIGAVVLGFMIMMTNMMITMSVENVQNMKGKKGGPF